MTLFCSDAVCHPTPSASVHGPVHLSVFSQTRSKLGGWGWGVCGSMDSRRVGLRLPWPTQNPIRTRIFIPSYFYASPSLPAVVAALPPRPLAKAFPDLRDLGHSIRSPNRFPTQPVHTSRPTVVQVPSAPTGVTTPDKCLVKCPC